MSVFTPVSQNELNDLLTHFDIGEPVEMHPVADGMENTNYFFTTHQDDTERSWVLTLFEMLEPESLPWVLQAVQILNDNGLPVPVAQKDMKGDRVHQLSGKPAIIVPRLKGQHLSTVSNIHCLELGKRLACVHLSPLPESRLSIPDIDDSRLWTSMKDQLSKEMDVSQRALFEDTLHDWEACRNQASKCPGGLIHGDLFKDNVLFSGDSITGIIDFYNAHENTLVYDIAITVNDWCRSKDGSLDPSLFNSFLAGYESARPLVALEKDMFYIFLQLAALRFWLSRIKAIRENPSSPLVKTKDPGEFENMLRYTRDSLNSYSLFETTG